MSKDSRTSHFFIYPKTKDKKHTGHTLCILLKEGKMYHGESLCSANDCFSKAIGRQISYERAMYEYERNKQERDRTAVKTEHSTWVEECAGSHQHVFQVTKETVGPHVRKVVVKTDKILDPNWTNHQEHLMTLESDGNGITIIRDGKSTRFDYAEWAYLNLVRVIEAENSLWKYNYTKG